MSSAPTIPRRIFFDHESGECAKSVTVGSVEDTVLCMLRSFPANFVVTPLERAERGMLAVWRFRLRQDHACWLHVRDVPLFVAKLATGLHELHSRGVLHGDLKPLNVLRRKSDDAPEIIDFGLSSIWQRDVNLCTTADFAHPILDVIFPPCPVNAFALDAWQYVMTALCVAGGVATVDALMEGQRGAVVEALLTHRTEVIERYDVRNDAVAVPLRAPDGRIHMTRALQRALDTLGPALVEHLTRVLARSALARAVDGDYTFSDHFTPWMIVV